MSVENEGIKQQLAAARVPEELRGLGEVRLRASQLARRRRASAVAAVLVVALSGAAALGVVLTGSEASNGDLQATGPRASTALADTGQDAPSPESSLGSGGTNVDDPDEVEPARITAYPRTQTVQAAVDARGVQAATLVGIVSDVLQPRVVEIDTSAAEYDRNDEDPDEIPLVRGFSYVYTPVVVTVEEVLGVHELATVLDLTPGDEIVVRWFGMHSVEGSALDLDAEQMAETVFDTSELGVSASLTEDGARVVLFVGPPVQEPDGTLSFAPSYAFDVSDADVAQDADGGEMTLAQIRTAFRADED